MFKRYVLHIQVMFSPGRLINKQIWEIYFIDSLGFLKWSSVIIQTCIFYMAEREIRLLNFPRFLLSWKQFFNKLCILISFILHWNAPCQAQCQVFSHWWLVTFFWRVLRNSSKENHKIIIYAFDRFDLFGEHWKILTQFFQ